MYFVFPFSASIYLGMDTADLLATTLIMARDRVLPEFTYLDQRGVGLWDSGDFNIVEPAVWAMDYMEAGRQGTGGRPPPNEDGTPNETLGDQFVRLRQFLSLQESRTSGENILVIFADVIGILGGYLVSVQILGTNPTLYFRRTWDFLELNDLYSGLIKAVFFGMILATISCYQGFSTQGGAEGVGRATTKAVVLSSLTILISNYFITALLF